MICLSLIRQALDPSFPAFKTEKGWGFLHHSQVLLLVYCQDFTIVLLVWPSLASPRRTDLTLGRGVTDAQLSASFSLLDSLFMHHRYICFNEKPRAKLQVFVFFPGDHFTECVQIFTLETRQAAKTWKKFECPDLTRLSSEEDCDQAPINMVSQGARWRTREKEDAGYSQWNTTPKVLQLSGWMTPSTGSWTWQGINRCQLNWDKCLIHIELLTCASHFIYCALVLIFITCLKIDMSIFLFDKERTMRFKEVKKACPKSHR